MKYKKAIIWCLCIVGIICFTLIKYNSGKNKAEVKTAALNSNSKTNTNSSTDTNADPSKGTNNSNSNTDSPKQNANTEKPDITTEGIPPNLEGNSPGNLNNGGLIAQQGNWMYFTLPANGQKTYPIYRSMKDGQTGLKSLTEPGVMYSLNVVNDWIYYIKVADNGYKTITRTKTDGSATEEILSNSEYNNLYINNGYIYYVKKGGLNTELYRLKLNSPDSSKSELLFKSSLYSLPFTLYCTNNLIYIGLQKNNSNNFDIASDANIYSINSDGTNLQRISADNINKFIVHDNYIYYTTTTLYQSLYRINIDGTNKLQVFSGSVETFNILNDNIYFAENAVYAGILTKISLDGKGAEELPFLEGMKGSGNYVTNIYTVNDSIFYLWNETPYTHMYRLKTDGSLYKQIH